MIININKATWQKAYSIAFEFSDGTKRTVDFGPFLMTARNPQIKQFQDLEAFKNFHLEYGDIIWGDYDMNFPIWDIYTGNIIKNSFQER